MRLALSTIDVFENRLRFLQQGIIASLSLLLARFTLLLLSLDSSSQSLAFTKLLVDRLLVLTPYISDYTSGCIRHPAMLESSFHPLLVTPPLRSYLRGVLVLQRHALTSSLQRILLEELSIQLRICLFQHLLNTPFQKLLHVPALVASLPPSCGSCGTSCS